MKLPFEGSFVLAVGEALQAPTVIIVLCILSMEIKFSRMSIWFACSYWFHIFHYVIFTNSAFLFYVIFFRQKSFDILAYVFYTYFVQLYHREKPAYSEVIRRWRLRRAKGHSIQGLPQPLGKIKIAVVFLVRCTPAAGLTRC